MQIIAVADPVMRFIVYIAILFASRLKIALMFRLVIQIVAGIMNILL